MNDIVVIDDFIPVYYQDKILNYCCSDNFPWYYKESSKYGNDKDKHFDKELVYEDNPQFTHIVNSSAVHDMFIPLVSKFPFNIQEILRIKLNIKTKSSLNGKFEIPHVDLLDNDELPKLKFITGLYYINDSDGDTILYNEKYSKDLQHPLSICKTVTPKKGRMVFFSGDRMHSAGYPSLSKKRIVANFNFYVDFY